MSEHSGSHRELSADGRSLRTVRHSLAWLDEHGLVTRTGMGNRWAPRGWSDTYRLSLPAPLAIALGKWEDEAKEPAWMERPVTSRGVRIPDLPTMTRCNPLHVVPPT